MPATTHRYWVPGVLAKGPIYLDANVIIGWSDGTDRLHRKAVRFVGDHLAASVPIHVSLLAIDEAIFHLLKLAVAQALHVPSVNLGTVMKRDPGRIQSAMPVINQAVQHVLGWASLVDARGVGPADVLNSWLDRIDDLASVHDSWHVAIAEHSGSRSFASGDGDFRRITNLPVAMDFLQL